jgi:hypothetical protein
MFLVAGMFPAWALRGLSPPAAPEGADFAQQVIGQRYFLPAPWHWPVLVAPGPMAPWGVNIAFTDSNPLAAVIAKLLRPVLPPFDQVVTAWQALCWLLQPAAAVFALRGAGERRLLPAAVVAVMAASHHAFLAGFWHSSLSSHFALLGMIGLYWRIVRGSDAALAAACVLLPALLLVHPYLAMMAGALLAAAPLTLYLRADCRWRRAALAALGSCACVVIVAILLGYTEGRSPGGYGRFSLNLLAPVFPVRSWLIPGFETEDLDATGGQLANDGYLGVGLILLVALTCATAWPTVRAAAARHRGLALCCVALWLLALSKKLYAGKLLLLNVHTAVGPLQMVRASSRLFWPVSYLALIGCVAALAAKRPRLALVVLPLCALLQFLDGTSVRAFDHARLNDPQPWLFDPDALRPLMRSATRLVIVPGYGCPSGDDTAVMQVLWIAAETRVPTNTAYVARIVHPQPCDVATALADAPARGDLLVVQPGLSASVGARPWAAADCRPLSAYTVCRAGDR